ncbi:uncharacterized protein LOC130895350 [Diorhabda carinulata]|uniref:uncharacterized protein LOC130895350 n=1 Tax=Diorhabda carinulata TaxID=1163345 RepID=UPI0025A0F2DA|nr:uncharacterized protein LOC130895350 [Diorhabda carinulata]
MGSMILVLIFFSVFVSSCHAENNETEIRMDQSREFVERLAEQGRTLARNSFKRLKILLPAIFFKLGIAFTMLVLVTIVSVNNGFIGFLLLVVGLSSVLARFQEARRTPVVPYVSTLPYYQQTKFIQDWDRKNRAIDVGEKETAPVFDNSYGQGYVYPQLGAYYKSA